MSTAPLGAGGASSAGRPSVIQTRSGWGWSRLLSGLLRGVVAVLLAALVFALWSMFADTPRRQVLTQATLRLTSGQSAVLGRHELAAPAADAQHLRISRDLSGAWWLQNVSPGRALELKYADHDRLLRTLPIEAEHRLAVAGGAWLVAPSAQGLLLQALPNGPKWVYDGAIVHGADGRPQPMCRDAGMSGRLRHAWNTSVPAALRWPAALQWGGTVACGNRLPSPWVAAGALQVVQQGGRFLLQGQAAATRQVCRLSPTAQDCDTRATLYEEAVTMHGATHLVAGRTRFALSVQGDQLLLQPVRRAGWLPADAQAPDVVALGGRGESAAGALGWEVGTPAAWRWPSPVPPWLALAIGFALAVAVATLAHVRRWGLQPVGGLALGMALVLSAASAWAYFQGMALGEGWSLALVSVALISVVAMPVRTGWAWFSQALVALMVVAGLALQLQLAVQSLDNGGWIFLQKTAAMAALGLFATQALACRLQGLGKPGSRLKTPSLLTLELALLVPAVLALLLLALQTVFGAEEGVFGIQPVELVKLALVLLGAHALALRMEWARQGGWRRWSLWLRMVMPVVLFMALGATALLFLDDYSPLLLMLGWLAGAFLAWALAAGSWTAAVLLLLALGGAAQGILWVQGDGLAWMQAHGFYGDRFAVWLELLRHPHSGEQVLRAIKVSGQGGWWGDPLAPAWRIPAVQYDMAPAFFVGRFGLVPAMALLLVQLVYVGTLMMLGWQALVAAGPGDFRRRWGLRLMFFAAWGGAAMFASHMVLSWGTNTGALPVMGQPLPLLSAGTSVMALLIAPLQMLWLLQPALLHMAKPGQYPRQHKA